ncbi:hypothetical protein MITS9509_02745 [Synechococcus sp. MIT S9509]|nr:hypothetical protein MITS9504_02099 [Synechococcus sp. MIT S9504]KZR90456.1 hypothetical protein MITS9509_02745 [Synechococcus sp. MIT S9509]
MVSIAKALGFSISHDDLKKAQSELSEVALEDVAGYGCKNQLIDLSTPIGVLSEALSMGLFSMLREKTSLQTQSPLLKRLIDDVDDFTDDSENSSHGHPRADLADAAFFAS